MPPRGATRAPLARVWIAGPVLFAWLAPGLGHADEETMAAFMRRDELTSATLISPAQLCRFRSPIVAAVLAHRDTTAGAADAGRSDHQMALSVLPLTASLTIAAALDRSHAAAFNTAAPEGAREGRAAAKAAVSFKLMDRVVLGAAHRSVKTLGHTHLETATEIGVALKSERSEFGVTAGRSTAFLGAGPLFFPASTVALGEEPWKKTCHGRWLFNSESAVFAAASFSRVSSSHAMVALDFPVGFVRTEVAGLWRRDAQDGTANRGARASAWLTPAFRWTAGVSASREDTATTTAVYGSMSL